MCMTCFIKIFNNFKMTIYFWVKLPRVKFSFIKLYLLENASLITTLNNTKKTSFNTTEQLNEDMVRVLLQNCHFGLKYMNKLFEMY